MPLFIYRKTILMPGQYIFPINSYFTGGTVSGQTTFSSGLTADTISSSAFLSGGTNLENIIKNLIDVDAFSGGTVISATNFLSSVSAATLYSGSSNVDEIFLSKSEFKDKNFSTNFRYAKNQEISYKDGNKQIVTYPLGIENMYGFFYAKGFLFGGTRTKPGKLVKINPDNLSDYSVVTFPTDGNHDYSESIIYVPEKEKIYVLFGDPNYSKTVVRIAEVDPITLEYTIIIVDDIGSTIGAVPRIISDGSYLYVTTLYYNNKLIKYDLDTFQRIGSIITVGTANNSTFSIETDGYNLYGASATWGTPFFFKVILSSMTVSRTTTSISVYNADEIVLHGNYLFVPVDTASNVGTGRIARVHIDDFTKYDIIDTYIPSACDGVHFNGKDIIAVFRGQPGKLVQINPGTLEVDVKYFDSGENVASEYTSDGKRHFIIFESENFVEPHTLPIKVARYPFIDFNGGKILPNITGGSNFHMTSGGSITIQQNLSPENDNYSSLGSSIKRFKNLNIINGVSVSFTASTNIHLGSREMTNYNIILSGDTIDGGTW